MSLYGNRDRLTLTGTVTTGSGSATVTGSGTAFTTEVEVGDIFLGGTDLTSANRVKSIASNTSLTLTANYNGSDTGSGKTAYIRETPRHLTPSDSNAIYGVSVEEITGGGDNVVSVAVDNQGSGYIDANDAGLTITHGAGSSFAATPVVTAGKVTSVTVTNVGSGYTSAPTIVVGGATNATFNANTVSSANDTIALTSAQVTALAVDDAVTYTNGGGSEDIGLTTGTVYYIHSKPSGTTVKLKTAVESGDAIDLTVGGNEAGHGLQGATATVTATLGSGNTITHPGWVKRTVGTGGRAGRINYEVLVASSSISSTGAADAADDIELPE